MTKPVFIVGHPRSGTSLLHRSLGEHPHAVNFPLWQLEFPSLTARFLFKPYINYRIKNKIISYPHAGGGKRTGRPINPTAIDHDEYLFFAVLDSQLLFTFFGLALDEKSHEELVYCDEQPHRRASARFLRKCFQRQMYTTGKSQVVAHVHHSAMRIKTLLEEFPDAKFIYLVRSPYEAIASHHSLHFKSLTMRYGDYINIDFSNPNVKRYFDKRYPYDCALYRYVEELNDQGQIPPEQFRSVRYHDLIDNMKATVDGLLEFTELPHTPEFDAKMEAKTESQKGYQRKHEVKGLEFFGLNQEHVYNDLKFVFEKYNLDK